MRVKRFCPYCGRGLTYKSRHACHKCWPRLRSALAGLSKLRHPNKFRISDLTIADDSDNPDARYM